MRKMIFRLLALSLISLTAAPALAKVSTNEKFPVIALKTLDGKKKFDMKDLKGKVVLVDFWAHWCEPCKISMPFLNQIARKYKGKVVVVGVNVDEDLKNATGFLKDHPAPAIRMVCDPKNEFVKQVGVNTMPSSFILDKNGVVKVSHQGFREDDKAMIETEIKKLLKGK